MATRTFREPSVNHDSGNGPNESAASGVSGSESECASGEPDADNLSVGNGAESESNIDGNSSRIGTVEIDPAELSEYIARDSAGTDSGSGAGKQRRKRGPNKRTTGAKKATDSVAPLITFIHSLMASKIPEMALADGEAEKVSDAYCEFCQHHDIPVMSAKRMSKINLIVAVFTVYGTRIMAIRHRHKEEDAAKRAKNVTPITAVM